VPFSEADVRALSSAQSFNRGYGYYQSGAVFDVIRRGRVVAAKVEGSDYEPYRVQVTLDESSVAGAECTCPYNWGGLCKHIIATLLFLLHDADQVEEKPELAQILAGLTETQLRQVLLGLAEEGLDFAESIEREVAWLQSETVTAGVTQSTSTKVDINAARRQIRKDFRQTGSESRGYGYFYDEYEDLELDPDLILMPHLEKVSALLDTGDVDAAVTLISAIVEAYIDGLTDLDEWIYEYNMEVIDEAGISLGARLAEVLLSLELNQADKEKWLAQIADWAEAVDGLEIAEMAVEQGWTYAPLVSAMQGNITEQGAWEGEAPYYADELTLARLRILERQGRVQEYINLAAAEGLTGLSIYMIAQSGDTKRAVSEAKAYLNNPSEVLSLAMVLVEQGEIDAALDVAKHGLGLEYEIGKVELARWTRDQASATSKNTLALQAAQVTFTSSYDLTDYKIVRELAGKNWPNIKPDLLKELQNCWSPSKKIDIFLHENMLAEAMQALGDPEFVSDYDLHRVVKATKEIYPDWGIRIYQQKAERIMDAGNSTMYETAVSYLGIARDIYQQEQRLEEWETYLDKLLETHHRKYKLVPMLEIIR
jgi:uncharacterized Zn finger protein